MMNFTDSGTLQFLGRELGALFLGDKLGEGIAREVYINALTPTHVIKIEHGAHSYQNTAEWLFWDAVKYRPALAKWFAPCHFLSPCGGVLIQERVSPLPDKRKPNLMPAFFCDFKKENYGLYKGRIVACDYGLLSLPLSNLSLKMHKAKWWESENQ
jgi:hypothetical protein